MKKYLATAPHNRYKDAFLHGQVDISDSGLVNGETPIEDFGMWYLSDKPITNNEAWKIWFAAIAKRECIHS